MELKDMTVEQLQERKNAIVAEIDTPEANIDALYEEMRGITEELEKRQADEAKRAEMRAAVAAGAGIVTEQPAKEETTEERKMFGVETIEYRDAWTKQICNRELNAEERAALTSAGAVIPTLTVNAVWDKLIQPAELLGRVDVSQFPSYVRFPKATTVNPATGQAVGGTISESSDVIGYLELIPNEYVKLLTVGADIDHMAIGAVHDWIVNNSVGSIRAKINGDILIGSGTNALKGLSVSVTASSTALPTTLTVKALLGIMGGLGANYQNGAVWIMTPAVFYSEVMSLGNITNYVVNDGFQFKLFGHDVVLMSEAAIGGKENIFYGDPKAYKVNIFKALEVKPFETATTTNIQFRGATMADGELIDAAAFVRAARA